MPSITVGIDPQLSSRIRQVSKSVDYTTVLTDSGKHILHPASDDNQRTFTIAANADVPYGIGTAITFINEIHEINIYIDGGDTLTLMGSGDTGSRLLEASGMATAVKITATSWVILGAGIT